MINDGTNRSPSAAPLGGATAASAPSSMPPMQPDAGGPSASSPPGRSGLPKPALTPEREALGEFTRALIQTMNRTAYYEPGHPAHYAVRDELYDKLAEVMGSEPQIGYLLQRGQTPEILVDGLPSGRVRLADVMMTNVYELFVPKFIEYFDRYELVLLALRTGITREEFGHFIAVMTRPFTRKEQKFDLYDALLQAGVHNVSILCADDVGIADSDLPWQIRVCLARLRRDLRTVPLFRHMGADAIRKVKLQIFQDTVRPLNNTELVKQLVLYAPRIEQDLAKIEGLEEMHVVANVVEALATRSLLDLARSLCDEIARDQHPERLAELRATVLKCAARLVREDVPDADPVLRLLYRHKLVRFEELPAELQDWLTAEAVQVRREDGTLVELPTLTERDIGVLAKVGRLSFAADRLADATEIADRLHAVTMTGDPVRAAAARRGLDALATPQELDALVQKYEAVYAKEAEPLARLIGSLGARAAHALVHRIVAAGSKARMGRAYHLLDRMPNETPDAVAAGLRQPDLAVPVLRILLALAAAHAKPHVAEAAAQHASHADAGVRLAAIVAVMTAQSPLAPELLRRALDDRDAQVVSAAMLALAEKYGGAAQSRERANRILEEATPETPSDLLLTAVRVISEHPPQDPAGRNASIEALKRLLAVEHEDAGFLGIGRRQAPHPDVVAPAQAALAALGGTADEAQPKRKSFLDMFRR